MCRSEPSVKRTPKQRVTSRRLCVAELSRMGINVALFAPGSASGRPPGVPDSSSCESSPAGELARDLSLLPCTGPLTCKVKYRRADMSRSQVAQCAAVEPDESGEAGQGWGIHEGRIMTASTGNVPGRIFVSYRHEDTAHPAGWLYDRLADHFGIDQIFKDIDAIEPGDDLIEVITTAVGSCDVLLALIGDRWLTVTGQDGRRRLDNPFDFVRLEIEAALSRDVRVIPIVVDDAQMPRADELPPSLASLARRQALELSLTRFDTDTRRLLQVLDQVVAEAQEQARQEAGATARRREQVERLAGQLREPKTGPSTSPETGPGTSSRGFRWPRGARTREGRSIFISYRRQLSESLALLIRKDLIEHRFDAFMDFENLDSGEFDRRILSQIEAREHFIVVLEPGSLDRISQDGDWLRREIAYALAHGRNVVPVTKGFEFRRDLVLPPDIARLPSFNAVAVPPGYFDAAMERLRTRFLKMPSNPTARP
jgi:TIR domain